MDYEPVGHFIVSLVDLSILAYVFWKEKGEDLVKTQHGPLHDGKDNSTLEHQHIHWHNELANAPVAKSLPAGDQSWTKVLMLNSPGSNSYPIATFTYLLLNKDLSTNPNLDQDYAKLLELML